VIAFGATQMVNEGLTAFPEWQTALLENVGDIVGDIARDLNQPVDTAVRMIHQDAPELERNSM